MGTDDPLELRLAARRNRAARNRLLLLVALVLATGAVAAVGVTLALNRHRDDGAATTVKGDAKPSERPPVATPVGNTGKPRGEWNHADLAAHLKAKGVEVRVEGGGASSLPNSILSVFVEQSTGDRVLCYLTPNDQAARDGAASFPKAESRGRFIIRDEDGTLYRRVLAALR